MTKNVKEIRSVKFEINKLDHQSDEYGLFEGYASVFNTYIPGYNEKVMPGAFTKTLQESEGRIPILWNHNSSDWIGIGRSAMEDKRGLKVIGKLALGTMQGNSAYALLNLAREENMSAGLSIGFSDLTKEADMWEVEAKSGKKTRLIREVKLFEYSITAFPANPKAFVTDVRTDEIRKWEDSKPDSDGEGEIRHRIREPEEFEADSFRRVTIQKEKPRVFSIMGKLKGEDSMTIQALRFPKEDAWTMEKAKAWVKEHPDVTHSDLLVDFMDWSDIPELDKALRTSEPPSHNKPDYHLFNEELAKIAARRTS